MEKQLCMKAESLNPEEPKFPFIALTVSGGHTQLVLVKSYEDFVELGTTLDDAASLHVS